MIKKITGLQWILGCCLFFASTNISAQEVLSVRDQAALTDELLQERFEHLLPELMKKTNIDCWVIISREYNEDPVLKTMLPAEWLSARRRTMLVFALNAATGKVEKHAVARYAVGSSIPGSWDMQKHPNQWEALVHLLSGKNVKKIGLNYSQDYGHADGINKTEFDLFMQYLPDSLRKKIVSAEPLAVAWLETRTEREIALYPKLIQLTRNIIREGFSEKIITPGVTTTDDLVWWFRQRIRDAGMDTWFHPTVSIQRSDSVTFNHLQAFSNRPRSQTILPGDLLHVDIGITYLRLNTDIQEHAYLLKPGESDVPVSLSQAFEKANRLQDLLTEQFKEKRTGNQALAGALAKAAAENIKATIYSHPIGFHGHAAGPTIGLWDQQQGVPGSGDYPFNLNTAYSIELNAATYIPEWKKEVRIMLEQDGIFTREGFRYLGGRQRKIWLVPGNPSVREN